MQHCRCETLIALADKKILSWKIFADSGKNYEVCKILTEIVFSCNILDYNLNLVRFLAFFAVLLADIAFLATILQFFRYFLEGLTKHPPESTIFSIFASSYKTSARNLQDSLVLQDLTRHLKETYKIYFLSCLGWVWIQNSKLKLLMRFRCLNDGTRRLQYPGWAKATSLAYEKLFCGFNFPPAWEREKAY